MRPDIDRERLSADTRAWLDDNGLTTRRASAIYPGINPAMISRACHQHVLSAASLLALCIVMKRDPTRYLIFIDPAKQKQAVTAIDHRETRRRA